MGTEIIMESQFQQQKAEQSQCTLQHKSSRTRYLTKGLCITGYTPKTSHTLPALQWVGNSHIIPKLQMPSKTHRIPDFWELSPFLLLASPPTLELCPGAQRRLVLGWMRIRIHQTRPNPQLVPPMSCQSTEFLLVCSLDLCCWLNHNGQPSSNINFP